MWQKGLISILFLLCVKAFAPPRQTYVFGYRVNDGEQELDAYVIRPIALGSPNVTPFLDRDNLELLVSFRRNQILSVELRRRAAEFVLKESTFHGFINEATSEDYEREAARIRSGNWPMVVITERGNPERILYTYCIAVPWADHFELLPHQSRFIEHVEELREKTPWVLPHQITDEEREDFSYRMFEINGGEAMEIYNLSGIFQKLPWVIGGAAELKLFMRSHEIKKSLHDVIHFLVMAHELHRYSGIPLTPEMRRQQAEAMQDQSLRQEVVRAFEAFDLDKPPEHRWQLSNRTFFKALREQILAGDFQGLVLNTEIYSHVSGLIPKSDRHSRTIEQRMYEKIGFPSAFVTFDEQGPWGTPGVRTGIYKLAPKHYELDMADRMITAKTYPNVEEVSVGPVPVPGIGSARLFVETVAEVPYRHLLEGTTFTPLTEVRAGESISCPEIVAYWKAASIGRQFELLDEALREKQD